jgi:hypothetical protein
VSRRRGLAERTYAAAAWAAAVLFGISAVAQLALFFIRPQTLEPAAGFTEPLVWRLPGLGERTLFLRPFEAAALDAVVAAGAFALLVATLGILRLRPRRRQSRAPPEI